MRNSTCFGRRRFATAAFLLLVGMLSGHPAVYDAVQRLDASIMEDPDNAELLLRRGGLHAGHGDFAAAAADYERAGVLESNLSGLDRARGNLFLALSEPAAARVALNRALAADPNDAEAMILRARAKVRLGDSESARVDYAIPCRVLTSPPPDLYLSRAALYPDDEHALAVLEEGLARLGPALVLQLRAFEIERRLERTDAALQRLDAIAAASERKESWLKLRGDVLAQGGRRDPAQVSYAAALEEIRALPSALRAGPDVAALEAQLIRLRIRAEKQNPDP